MKTTLKTGLFVLVWMCSAALAGAKTLYYDQTTVIKGPARILFVRPVVLNAAEGPDKSFDLLEEQLVKELHAYPLSLGKSELPDTDFEQVGQVPLQVDTAADFLLFTQLKRLTSMGQTRDYKISYKLVSVKDQKLVFHSSFNTSTTAVLVLPGIKNFPNNEEMMSMAMRLALRDLKKKVLKS